MELMPVLIAENFTRAKVPLPVTPGSGPSNVLPVKLISPPKLSITPGMKYVFPPVARNEPSVMSCADNLPGSKLIPGL